MPCRGEQIDDKQNKLQIFEDSPHKLHIQARLPGESQPGNPGTSEYTVFHTLHILEDKSSPMPSRKAGIDGRLVAQSYWGQPYPLSIDPSLSLAPGSARKADLLRPIVLRGTRHHLMSSGTSSTPLASSERCRSRGRSTTPSGSAS